MKIANPNYDLIFKYLVENDEIAKDILSIILEEEIVPVDVHDDVTNLKIARIIRHVGKIIFRNSDLMYVLTMEDFMETEAERDRIYKEQTKQKIAANKITKMNADLETKKLKREIEILRLQLKKQNDTPSV